MKSLPRFSSQALDEEALAGAVLPQLRRERGVYFTPASVVTAVLDIVGPLVPAQGALAVIDPACGAGAFLSAAAERFPAATLIGLELSAEYRDVCLQRVPRARVLLADALRDDASTQSLIPGDAFELWLANPPYNGTSAVLREPQRYSELRSILGKDYQLPRGTSLRDDFAFFLLRAAERLRCAAGALAFVTPTTLLNSFLYAPLRHALLDRLRLVEVLDLGEGVFTGTRVRACVTVWTNLTSNDGPPRYRARTGTESPFEPSQLSAPQTLTPRQPEWLLRPVPVAAEHLDLQWRQRGESITTLLPVTFSGLKTRFDELLVDDDRGRLVQRMGDFLSIPMDHLSAFAREHDLPTSTFAKLEALKTTAVRLNVQLDPGQVRPFFRYAGARHRGAMPGEAKAFCYLDRRLIPRGDHRFRGAYDPHLGAVKLLFNVRELPLCAAILEEEGCVHDHRHTRFAPLWVPERIRREGLTTARQSPQLGAAVANLSERGLQRAEVVGGPLALFRAIVAFINSEPVQRVWAPALGTIRALPVPVDTLGDE